MAGAAGGGIPDALEFVARVRTELYERHGLRPEPAGAGTEELLGGLREAASTGAALTFPGGYVLPAPAAAEMLAQMESLAERHPDEDPFLFAMIERNCAEAIAAFRALGHELADPVVATLPTGSFNARLLLPPGAADPVVVFESALVAYLFEVSRILSHALPALGQSGSPEQLTAVIPSQDAIVSHLETTHATRGPFVGLVYGMFVAGSLGISGDFEIAAGTANLASSVFDSGALFIAAHELAHVVLRAEGAEEEVEDDAAGLVRPAAQRELEADALALEACAAVWARRRESAWWSYACLEFFLASIWMTQAAKLTLIGGDPGAAQNAALSEELPDDPSHPSPRARQLHLREWILAHGASTEVGMELAGGLVQAETMDVIAIGTFQLAAPSLTSLAPGRVHPRFRAF